MVRETMPKNPSQDKKSIPRKRAQRASEASAARFRAPPQGLDEIMKRQGWLQGLQRARGAQQAWLDWAREALPSELGDALINVVQRGQELTVLTVSAAWCARVRYAMAALEPQLMEHSPDIVKVIVRVAPAGR
jgi:hypothetical protein